MYRTLIVIPALVALALACPAAAQTAAPPADGAAGTPNVKKIGRNDVSVSTRIGVEVNGHALEALRPVVTDESKLGPLFLRMVLIARQEAVGARCAAYSVDPKRQVAVMLGAIAPAVEGLEMDAAQTTTSQILRHYHTMLGGAIAQYAVDPDGFCAAGEELYKRLSGEAESEQTLILTPAA